MYQFLEIPSWDPEEADVIYADLGQQHASCFTHYAYAIASTDADWAGLARRRTFNLNELRDWPAFSRRFPEATARLQRAEAYRPGASVLENPNEGHWRARTAMRLGALELIANIGSGRIASNDKDPFPHQLQLQQFMQVNTGSVRRLLIADEVGLGKTIEIAMILRDLLIAQGSLDNFSCVYFTSGGLLQDAEMKLRSVLKGAIGDQNMVEVVDSLRGYGRATATRGVHVASMHAARLLTGASSKSKLTAGIAPRIVIIDECHHCASDNDLTGKVVSDRTATTKTYVAAHQLISGTFWPESSPPDLVVLMSATPFRSRDQFTNLLRLLMDGVKSGGASVDAYGVDASAGTLSHRLESVSPAVSIVWRRQDDPTVHSWRGRDTRLFPNLRVVRPHRDQADCPKLPPTSPAYLELMLAIRDAIRSTMRTHETPAGGFTFLQLEKKLTSSSLAGACYLLSWCIRHSAWETQDEFKQDQSQGTNGIRELLRSISQRLAEFDVEATARHANVHLASEDFLFEAKSIAQGGHHTSIYDLSKKLRAGGDDSFVATREEVAQLVELGRRLLSFSDPDRQGVENAKLAWLQTMLERFPESRFLIFTESLQTCTIINSTLPRTSRRMIGSMGDAERDAVVAEFRDPRKPIRVLVATSAADEGFDLQVANKVIHWDLSSSPAVLMQRNGRVARLGQISDVVAYYLIIAGTHEERRDNALLERFGDLGIDDERLRLRILGLLTEEEEDRLEHAIETNDGRLVGDILLSAAQDNTEMANRLDQIRTELGETHALDRTALAERLRRWYQLGLPDHIPFDLEFEKLAWRRPVFGEITHLEDAEADVAKVKLG
ncbi:MAG TPA: DEAD/DEAH box helicase, partial [Galbitalea sp.]|nr:DEAD/DEAH box helicase [Galbitalea sp.]